MASEATVNRLDVRLILSRIDSSSLSDSPLVTAAAAARAHDAELRALHVVAAEAGVVLESHERTSLMALPRQQREDAGLGPHQCGSAVRLGDPGMEILRFAGTTRVHVIVMEAAGADRLSVPRVQ